MPHKIWAFLNSTFGVWVLSSVVLAWITKTYATWQAHKTASQARVATTQRLDTEIAFRLAMAFDLLRSAEHSAAYTNAVDIYRGVYNCLENFFINDPGNPRDFSLYPEFRERTFRALLLELRNVLPDTATPDLKSVLDAYEEITDIASWGSADTAIEARSTAVNTLRTQLQTQMVRTRWRPMVDFLIVRGNATTTTDPSRTA